MKKNKMLRIASVLLIVTILSTVAISGTFAKYITKYSGNDTARVAKFGFDITVDGDLFKTAYENAQDDTIAEAIAVQGEVNKIVAPGTSNDEYTISIDGVAEVATRFKIKLVNTANFSDIVLPAGEYLDYTTADNATDKFTLAADYYPVRFKVVANGMLGTTPINDFEILPTITLTKFSEVVAAGGVPTASFGSYSLFFDDGYLCFDIPAGKEVDVTFTGSWEWAFENAPAGLVNGNIAPLYADPADAATIVDKADTFLGRQAYDGNAQELKFSFEAVAEQINEFHR